MSFKKDALPKLQVISGKLAIGQGDKRAHVTEAKKILSSGEYESGMDSLGKLCGMMPGEAYMEAWRDIALGLRGVCTGASNIRLVEHAERLHYGVGRFIETFLDDIDNAFKSGEGRPSYI